MKKIIIILCIFLYLIICFVSINIVSVFAEEEVEYSDVLDDLKKDKNFDVNSFEKNKTINDVLNSSKDDDLSNDLSFVSVIQIGESSSNELFIYTYEPTRSSHPIKLDSIALNCNYSNNGVFEPNTIKSFNLKLVSEYDVFCKYIVEDFVVSNETYRYYNITTIWRDIDKDIDTDASDTTSHISHAVGQQWCCYYVNDIPVYEMNTFDVLEITPILNASVTFSNGFSLGQIVYDKYCNSHFVSFNIEEKYDVTKIFDGDITYKTRKKTVTYGLGLDSTPQYSEESEKPLYKTLYSSDSVTYKGYGLFAKTFKWNRICSASEFKSSYEKQGGSFSDEAVEKLNKSQWVFAFMESDISRVSIEGMVKTEEIECFDVSVLRLHFQTPQGTYNLGVVMDKTYTSGIVGTNKSKDLPNIIELLQLIIMLIGFVILVLIFVACAPFISFIFDCIFYVITLPFKFIGKLFNIKK